MERRPRFEALYKLVVVKTRHYSIYNLRILTNLNTNLNRIFLYNFKNFRVQNTARKSNVQRE